MIRIRLDSNAVIALEEWTGFLSDLFIQRFKSIGFLSSKLFIEQSQVLDNIVKIMFNAVMVQGTYKKNSVLTKFGLGTVTCDFVYSYQHSDSR